MIRNKKYFFKKEPARHLNKQRAGKKTAREIDSYPMAHLSEGSNSAKEDKNWLQDAWGLLSIDYSKIILVLIKKGIAKAISL